MNKIAVIIVTFNRKHLLIRCLNALKKQTIMEFDILVVDNASTDGTKYLFEKKKKNIFYYNTGKNLGGAGGFNYGIRKAVENEYDYLWIMDDDTLPANNALEEFLKIDEKLKGNYGFLSGKVLWKNQEICIMNRQKITKWKYIKNFDVIQNIQYASFVSLFLPVDTVKKIGLPMKEFFIWTDDWEYTRRISKYKISYFVPNSIVIHWCNNNIGADIINSEEERLDRFKYMYRNDVCLYRLDGFEGYLYLLIRTIVHIIRIILKSNNKKVKINLMISALREGLKFNPVIEYIESSKK